MHQIFLLFLKNLFLWGYKLHHKKRNNFNLDLLNKFKKIQLPLNYKKKKSHFIIQNNFNNEYVKICVKKIIKKIL